MEKKDKLLKQILKKFPISKHEKKLEQYNYWLYNMALAERIAKWYNDGWFPDFDNPDERRWSLRYERDSNKLSFISYGTFSPICNFPIRLLFKDKKSSLEAQELFPEIFKTAIVG